MKGVKLQDVAKLAGVSPATVTRVLHDSGYVSEEKRILVENAMRELGYESRRSPAANQPNPVFRALMFTPGDSSNPLFDKIVRQIGLELQQHDWQLLCHYTPEGPLDIANFTRTIDKLRPDNLNGLIFNCIGDHPEFMDIRRYLIALPFPVIMIERAPDIYGINKILMNSEECSFTTVKYLAHMGHRNILFISVDNDREPERMRIHGFRFGVSAMDIAETCDVFSVSDYTYENGYNAIHKYLESHPLPTAIITPDPLAVGVLHYLHSRGHRVPEDVSIISLDDTHSLFTSPQLTSVAFPIPEIAQHTARILIEAQRGNTLPQNILLSTKLNERDSVAPPRKNS